MKIYTLHEILITEHLGDEKYVRYEEIERLRGVIKDMLSYIPKQKIDVFSHFHDKVWEWEQAVEE